jgi:hypothetical protein
LEEEEVEVEEKEEDEKKFYNRVGWNLPLCKH